MSRQQHSQARRTKPPRQKVALALQGGGSHGAFTWGVLDRILDDPTIEIIGVTGPSAGAVNAAPPLLAACCAEPPSRRV
jgi:NTE family protein